MRTSHSILVKADGKVYRYEVEARSQRQALFLAGVTFGQENPDLITAALEISVKILA